MMGKQLSCPLFPPPHREPEILNKILGQIPANRGGIQTLIACALVVASWTRSSQRCLFSLAEFHDGICEQRMRSIVFSGSKTRLEHVLLLRHSRGLNYRIPDLPRDSRSHFSAPYSLMLSIIGVENVSEGFRHSVGTYLSASREIRIPP